MLRYGVYARKSDTDEAVTEKSIGDQLAEILPIIDREQLSVVGKPLQESQSAKIPNKRPKYAELIAMVESGKIDAVVCYHINRLVRNMEEGGKLVQLLIEGKIQEIRTPTSIHRTGDNILPLVIEAASATQFSLDLSKRVTIGMRSKYKKGGCNYKVPQGYINARDPLNLEVGIIIKDSERYDLIQKAWDMMLTGAYTPKQIADTLNDVWGFRTRKTMVRGGDPIMPKTVSGMFSNIFYAGFMKERGQIVKGEHYEMAMVTAEQFNRVQEIMQKNPVQSPHTHEYPYTGLMLCAYCGQQVTAETRTLANGNRWQSYHCSDTYVRCTKQGMQHKVVEQKIISALESITLDPELCEIALDNILRDLNSQTSKVQTLYGQQNRALEESEAQLSNLAEMWIKGLMRDEKLYKTKEEEITSKKNDLVVEVEKCRRELETMRANAMSSSNYVVFARDNFMVGGMERKREIAHALGVKYLFYGKEKEIDVEVHPLLLELVNFAYQLEKPLAVDEIGSDKQKEPNKVGSVPYGGP